MAENDGRTPSQHIAVGAPAHIGTANNSAARTQPVAGRAKAPKSAAAAAEPKDSLREVVETVVFVVVLVLLLKSFVAEAFVIPTGSMAETLYGYQKMVVCPKCKFEFPVNCSCEVDPQGEPPADVIGCTCPNCRYHLDFAHDFDGRSKWPSWNTGDRVLVGKYFYDLDIGSLRAPHRYEVVVFKYPKEPQKGYTPLNYIKRLIGLSGETIAIHYGKLYCYDKLTYDDRDVPEAELWQHSYMHDNDRLAEEAFGEGKFWILRKPPEQVLSERRIVYDNDHQATDLNGKPEFLRWQAKGNAAAWVGNNKDAPTVFHHAAGDGGQIDWLRYQHLIPDDNRTSTKPELITDFMGYNTFVKDRGFPHPLPSPNWVGDLMVECNVDVQQPQGDLLFELSKGVDRFLARFDLASGRCTLVRVDDDGEQELGSQETILKKGGKHRVRFANVDDRLLVWVDSSLPFGDGLNYTAPRRRGPWAPNDLERPASIGVKNGGVAISELKLWRDTYYPTNVDGQGADHGNNPVDFGDPKTWGPLRDLRPRTMYVQPNHFLCMGDNSPESSDGRSWGTVPRRLLLGRALLTYYPFLRSRAGRIE
ncbi:MAG TPA: signal peptidase I [Gemmataceae bacterium]|nr:signal peptidase I [Gemmataceae bacterium]